MESLVMVDDVVLDAASCCSHCLADALPVPVRAATKCARRCLGPSPAAPKERPVARTLLLACVAASVSVRASYRAKPS